jgi:hypothetical protein
VPVFPEVVTDPGQYSKFSFDRDPVAPAIEPTAHSAIVAPEPAGTQERAAITGEVHSRSPGNKLRPAAVSAGANVKGVRWVLRHACAAMPLAIYADLFDDIRKQPPNCTNALNRLVGADGIEPPTAGV